jgi:hypothetical protein
MDPMIKRKEREREERGVRIGVLTRGWREYAIYLSDF